MYKSFSLVGESHLYGDGLLEETLRFWLAQFATPDANHPTFSGPSICIFQRNVPSIVDEFRIYPYIGCFRDISDKPAN